MAAVRSTGNLAEKTLRLALHSRGFRYRRYSADLAGRPDLVFPRLRAVVFVDGDFWHGRKIREAGSGAIRSEVRSPNRETYWLPKLTRNIQRDDYVSNVLREQGWMVIRVWESDIKKDAEAVANEVARLLSTRDRKSPIRPR